MFTWFTCHQKQSVYLFCVPDSQVIQVSVSDKDSPTTGNGQVDVSIDGGSFGKFTVRSGGTLDDVILANIVTSQDATFDYDVQRLYNLTVSVMCVSGCVCVRARRRMCGREGERLWWCLKNSEWLDMLHWVGKCHEAKGVWHSNQYKYSYTA